MFSLNEIIVFEFSIITLFCFSFRQQILSFKKFDVPDLGIFLDKVFTLPKNKWSFSPKSATECYQNRYPQQMFAIIAYRKQHQTLKLNITDL